MNVYLASTGRVFHRTTDCPNIGAGGTAGDIMTTELADTATIMSAHGRLIRRCRRCWPGMVSPAQEVISIGQAASMLGMSKDRAVHLAREGKFPGAFRFADGSWWRVSVTALEKFLEAPVSG